MILSPTDNRIDKTIRPKNLRGDKAPMSILTTAGFDLVLDIVKHRSSIRKLKPDPIPDDYIQKTLEVGQ